MKQSQVENSSVFAGYPATTAAKMVNVSHRVMGLLDAKLITDPFTPAPVTISFSCL